MTKPMCNVALTLKLPLAAKGYTDGIFCERLTGHSGKHKAEFSGTSCISTSNVDACRASETVQWSTEIPIPA